MAKSDPSIPVCFLSITQTREGRAIAKAVEQAANMAGFAVTRPDPQIVGSSSLKDAILGEIARADCMIIELSYSSDNGAVEAGMAEAMGKPIILIASHERERKPWVVPHIFSENEVIIFSDGDFEHLAATLADRLTNIRKQPQRRTAPGRRYTPFFVDWERLDRSDGENLCRELMTQMGFLRLDWFKHSREIDMVAELPKKDPDGFEYRELWLVAMGHNAPTGMVYEMALHDSEMFVDRFIRRSERLESMPLYREDIPLTLLFVTFDEASSLTREFDEPERRLKMRRRYPNNLRIRHWDRAYLTNLVQQFPQLGYKYFSDEARAQSKFRKSYEELYTETLRLNERLAATNKALEDEKNARVRAERDAVWKDISFAAAHRIGNPIFAIETVLEPLLKRINENRKDEAVEVVGRVRVSVDKAKDIVDQFKSLTKAQEINAAPCNLHPILVSTCRPIQDQGVALTIDCPEDIVVLGDVERLTEVFDELVANALKWLEGPVKAISVSVISPNIAPLPASVDSSKEYALVHFADNGPGVAVENKGKIFHAFFTTHDHGTGLGLALVRRVIEGHGGVILEGGVPGKGADFEIYLPLPTPPKGGVKRKHKSKE